MASTSETGHAKNVANLELLLTAVNSYGANYNPSNTALRATALGTLLTSARNALNRVNEKSAAYNNATNARAAQFAPLKKLCTRIVNTLAASGVPEATVDDARSINRKIQGQRTSAVSTSPPDPNAPSPNTISTSQQSFDLVAENFARLIALLESVPAYNPNEADLKVASLKTLLLALRAATQSTGVAAFDLQNARNERNTVLYASIVGLFDIAGAVKKYVKGSFGAESPEYTQLSGIKFTKPA